MQDSNHLESELRRIDGRGYKAYKDVRGSYRIDEFTLHIDHVQGDPFAAPSRLCVEISRRAAGLGPELDPSAPSRLALSDFLARSFALAIREVKSKRRGGRGMGKSGLIEIDAGGQEILKRTAVVVDDDKVEARFVLGLPARGRTVLGREAFEMLLGEVPEIVSRSLFYSSLDADALAKHIEAVEDWNALSAALADRGLVSFIADGSILPRRSGIDPRALSGDRVVRFESPSELRVELPALSGDRVVRFESPSELRVELPLSGGRPVTGLGIREGVTLIVGGGFHGKSTLLDAIALGVYPHIPGDGRERVATRHDAVKVRAEDGRGIESVDISPFIDNLPFGKDTTRFSTDNASGSTSQAANIIEALEMGASALLLDEDTSATNFMIRDLRMQKLVAKDREPITPFIDRAREIRDAHGCSTVMVVGGSGDYFDVADRVIQMDEYLPADVTDAARRVADEHPTGRATETPAPMGGTSPRSPSAGSFDPSRGRREVKIGAKGLRQIVFGTTTLELDALEQMVDPSQTRAIGELIHLYSTRYLEKHRGLRQGVEAMMADLDEKGLDLATASRNGSLAMPRAFEVAAAINRMRTLRIK